MKGRTVVSQATARHTLTHTRNVCNLENEIRRSRPLTPCEEERLFAEYSRTHDPRIRERIIGSVFRFAHSVAKVYSGNPETVIDLTMEAMSGATEAFGKYNPDSGVRFITYAVHYMHKMMVEYMHGSRMIRRGTDIAIRSKVTKVTDEFYSRYERLPDADEVCEIIRERYGIPCNRDQVREITVSGMDEMYGLTSDSDERVFSDSEAVPPSLDGDSRAMAVSAFLSCLTDRERDIVTRSFGIGSFCECTSDELAREYGLTVARVNQIKLGAMRKMRMISPGLRHLIA